MNLLEVIVLGFVAFNVLYFACRFVKEQAELPKHRPSASFNKEKQRAEVAQTGA
ncbi:hypothetical protein [Salinithrix halophila]|uniref:Uncharacterized protein n=1 Tax=Salinithrix halophila TaxID=1485204 RepID=A0ABV8JC85_9BACL